MPYALFPGLIILKFELKSKPLFFLSRLRKNFYPDAVEAGCDEAGRGCLAGPVVAAAVVLSPRQRLIHALNDSKQLSPGKREQLVDKITQKAEAYGIATVDNNEIDKLNILQASVKAMNLAVEQMSIKPEWLLIDGHYFHTTSGIPFHCIKKGDAWYASIAAASVLAKVYRDQLMENYHHEYPVYQWHSNKGYPTPPHRKAIARYGPSPLHRESFNLIKQYKQLKFNL